MSRLKALFTGLTQNPGLFRVMLEDPRAFASFAGLGEAELSALGGLGNAVSNLVGRFGYPHGTTPAAFQTPAGRQRTNAPCNGGSQSVAIAGIVSLLAVAGALTAVGTVSLVALAHRDEN